MNKYLTSFLLINKFDLLVIIFYAGFCLASVSQSKLFMLFILSLIGLYILFFEFVPNGTKQILSGSLNQLNYRNSLFDSLGMVTFSLVAGIFGYQSLIAALFIIITFFTVSSTFFIIVGTMLGVGVIIFDYTEFDYIQFFDYPHQFIIMLENNGFLFTIHNFILNFPHQNIGQLCILLPYLLFKILLCKQYNRNNYAKIKHKNEQIKLNELKVENDTIDFGIELATGERVLLSHQELNTHMYINGATGSGKTVAMQNFVIEALAKKIPMVYIDGKGSTDLENKISKLAKDYGRSFKVFTLSPELVLNVSSYDFLGSGTFTEKKNRIMQLFMLQELLIIKIIWKLL